MSDKPHLYGTADEDNRQPTPEQGMRGERTAEPDAKPENRRDAPGFTVEEESGVAAAEAGMNRPSGAARD